METTDGPTTFATRNGDLVDVLRVDGTRQMRDPEANIAAILLLDTRLRAAFEDLGHGVEFKYV